MFSASSPLLGKQDYKWSDRGAASALALRAIHEHAQQLPEGTPTGPLSLALSLSLSHPHLPSAALAVRFADLSKEERKAVVKTVNKRGTDNSDDHAYVCTEEIGQMLACFKENNWDTAPCQEQVNTMYACVDARKYDPDPKVLSRRWQSSLKTQVFMHFAKKRLSFRK